MRIGGLDLLPISDGTFVARPAYFGEHLPSATRPEFFGRHGAAWLPIGSFLVRTRDRLVLIDAGLGPELEEMPHRMYLVGGQLLVGLRVLGVAPTDITDVVCTHLHPGLADRTRERLWRELEGGQTIGAGAHFPELRFGRVLPGLVRRWQT